MSRVMRSCVCAAQGAAVALVDASLHVLICKEEQETQWALNIQHSPTSVRKQALESPLSLILSLLVLICNRNIPVYCEYHYSPTALPNSQNVQ